MNLTELMHLLPATEDDGTYFELRKQESWLCVKTNWRTNKDHLSNTGRTPEEAVSKMLVRIGRLDGCAYCFHTYEQHAPRYGCSMCGCQQIRDAFDIGRFIHRVKTQWESTKDPQYRVVDAAADILEKHYEC